MWIYQYISGGIIIIGVGGGEVNFGGVIGDIVGGIKIGWDSWFKIVSFGGEIRGEMVVVKMVGGVVIGEVVVIRFEVGFGYGLYEVVIVGVYGRVVEDNDCWDFCFGEGDKSG